MKKMQTLVIALTCLFAFCSISFAQPVFKYETVDGDNESPFQRNGMHACPDGKWVTGFHLKRNLLLCSNGIGGINATADLSKEKIDGDNEAPTQRNGMHACPPGYAITGIEVNKNRLSCAPFFTSTPQYLYIENIPRIDAMVRECNYWCQVSTDPLSPVCADRCLRIRQWVTRRQGMHSCEYGEVLIGLDASNNRFLCGSVRIQGDITPDD